MRVNPNYVTDLVGALDVTTATEQRLTGQVSSGIRLSALSDDPVAAGQNTLLSAKLGQDVVFIQTASSTEGTMQVADTALGSVVSSLTQAISVATAGSSGTGSTANMNSVAQQLSGIRDEVLSLANTGYMGPVYFCREPRQHRAL